MTDYIVGPGIRGAMARHGDTPTESERKRVLSMAAGKKGLYLYSKARNRVAFVPFDEEAEPAPTIGLALDVSNWSGRLRLPDLERIRARGYTRFIPGTQDRAICQQQLEVGGSAGLELEAYCWLSWDGDTASQVRRAEAIVEPYPVEWLTLDVEEAITGYRRQRHVLGAVPVEHLVPISEWVTAGMKVMGITQANVIEQIHQAVDACTLKVRIYTGRWAWLALTGDTDEFRDVSLHYAHFDGQANFDDWPSISFGGWAMPDVKQYQGTTLLENVSCDLNCYWTEP